MKEGYKRIGGAAVILTAVILLQCILDFSVFALPGGRSGVMRLDVKGNSYSLKDRHITLAVKLAALSWINELSHPVCPDGGDFFGELFKGQESLGGRVRKVLKKYGAPYGYRIDIRKEKIHSRGKRKTVQETLPIVGISLGRACREEKWALFFPPLCYLPEERSIYFAPGLRGKLKYRLMLWDLFKKRFL
ncbi:MAG: hypothetical protein ACM3WV_02180 [Bacillota bacterium]